MNRTLVVVVIALIIFACFLITQTSIALTELHFGPLSEIIKDIIYGVSGVVAFIFVRFGIWSKKPKSPTET